MPKKTIKISEEEHVLLLKTKAILERKRGKMSLTAVAREAFHTLAKLQGIKIEEGKGGENNARFRS